MPTDDPSTVPTAVHATNDEPFKCNQSPYPNPNHNFALPQFVAPPNSDKLDPTDTPSAVQTTLQASCDLTFNPKCAHNLMENQCNQPQYLILLNKYCAHNPSTSQVSQTNLSNSLAFPYHQILGSMF